MKKTKFLFCLVSFLLLIVLVSCGNKTIKEELALEIINAYAEKNNIDSKDLSIDYYFGQYKKYHVLYISKDINTFVKANIQIGDYFFEYSANKAIEVYKDGEFYTLSEVYNNKLIKERHLKKIYNQTNLFLETIWNIYYSYNKELKEKGLTEEAFNQIIKIHNKDRIIDYYGKYDEMEVVALESFVSDKEYCYKMDILWDGNKYDMIRAFDNEKMYTLEEAYNSKKLSLQEIGEIFQVVYGYLPYMIIANTNTELMKQSSFALVYTYYHSVFSKENTEIELFELWEKYNQNVYCYLHNNLKTVWLYTEGEDNNGTYVMYVEGCEFELKNNQTILVYFGNEHYTLGKAYDEGLLSTEELDEIYYSYIGK